MNRTVVVTGASAGVGRALALEFARCHDTVVLIARGERGLAAAAREVEQAGGQPIVLPVDVADSDAVFAAADQVIAMTGALDLWINVAFSSVFAPFDEVSAAEFRRATEVTYLGYVYGTMAALKHMKARGSGTIVHTGSALAYRGIPLQTVYCGAKHAIQGFHESLRCELLHERSPINVTMVQLPALNTPQFSWLLNRLPRQAQPVPPIFQPEVAARAIRYAAEHPRRREYWVGSTTAATLLANAVAPGLLDRYLGRTGFSSQQANQRHDPDAPVNLWEPADGPDGKDFGARGAFTERAHDSDPQVWLSEHHGAVGTATAGLALLAGAGRWRRGRRP